jgi:transcriptional antiterminator RfaH
METRIARRRDQADSVEAVWYCLRSQPKQEHIEAARLRKLDRVAVFRPWIRFKRATRQDLVWVTEAMFPGYLFAQFELAAMHRQVRYAHGVSGIVQFGDRYPTIGALAQLRDHSGPGEVKEVSYELSQADQAKIPEGAFVGLEAVVTRALPAKSRVKILMGFLGRKIEAEVERSSVLPQVAHPLAA